MFRCKAALKKESFSLGKDSEIRGLHKSMTISFVSYVENMNDLILKAEEIYGKNNFLAEGCCGKNCTNRHFFKKSWWEFNEQ